MDAMAIVSIFVLAVFVGFEVVSKVSSTLHTPLMSGANAIHGVILVGAIIVADHSETTLELEPFCCGNHPGNNQYDRRLCRYRSHARNV